MFIGYVIKTGACKHSSDYAIRYVFFCKVCHILLGLYMWRSNIKVSSICEVMILWVTYVLSIARPRTWQGRLSRAAAQGRRRVHFAAFTTLVSDQCDRGRDAWSNRTWESLPSVRLLSTRPSQYRWPKIRYVLWAFVSLTGECPTFVICCYQIRSSHVWVTSIRIFHVW